MGTTKSPQEALEYERDSPKVNVFCALSQTKVYGLFFFAENTVTVVTYLAMLQNWLVPQMSEDSEDFIFQQNGDPPHWHRDVCSVPCILFHCVVLCYVCLFVCTVLLPPVVKSIAVNKYMTASVV